MNHKLTILLCLLLACLQASAVTIYVDKSNSSGVQDGNSWATAYKSLAFVIHNINGNTTYDTVLVAKGVYYPEYKAGNLLSSRTFLVTRKKLAIIGGYPPAGGTRNLLLNPTCLNGSYGNNNADSSHVNHVMMIVSPDLAAIDSSLVIDGFIMENAYQGNGLNSEDIVFAGSSFTYVSFSCTSGGGMLIYAASPKIYNCQFLNNNMLGSGAGVSNQGIAPFFENCIFKGNTGLGGAGLCNLSPNGIIDKCTFTNNHSTYNGGGLWTSVCSTLKITNSVFKNNYATGFGGGLFTSGACNNGILSTADVTNCDFFQNYTPDKGGGLAADNGSLILKQCRILGNSSNGDGGGGIYLFGSQAVLQNCLLAGNNAVYAGSAMYNWFSNAKLLNCTITKNQNDVTHGCIMNDGSEFTAVNSIIDANKSPYPFTNYNIDTVRITNSDIEGGFNGTNNLNLYPSFVDTVYSQVPFIKGDFSLQLSSPVVNKGNNDSVPSYMTTDIAGHARVYGDTVDMGAFEYGVYLPAVNLGGDTVLCNADTITLDAGNAGASYLWSTGDTAKSIKVFSGGTYFVHVTNAAGGGSDTIIVYNAPQSVLNLGNDTVICIGEHLRLDIGNEWQSTHWSYNGITNSFIDVVDSGIYSAVATDFFNCVFTDSLKVTINALPFIGFDVNTSVCLGDTIILDAQNPTLPCLWSTGDTTHTIAVFQTGTYTASITDTNGCIGKDSIYAYADSIPVVHLGNDTTLILGSVVVLDAGNFWGSSYLWNTGAIGQSITVQTSGIYWLDVTDIYGCTGEDSIVVNFTGFVNIKSPGSGQTISISPNPTKNEVIINGKGLKQLPLYAILYDVYGHKLKKIALKQEQQVVSLREYNPGTYFLTIPGLVDAYKIIKE